MESVVAEIVTHELVPGGTSVVPSDEVQVHFAAQSAAARSFLPGRSDFEKAVTAAVRDGSSSETLVHDHGIWLPSNHATVRAAWHTGVPRVVSVRGMLSPWSLARKSAMKWAAWRLYQRRDLEKADLLHATSETECRDIQRSGLTLPVAVIPNGVAVPARIASHPDERKTRRALFLSRLHPVKGLLDLVEAWAIVRPEGWELVLAGPDADGHRAEVEREVRGRGLTKQVQFIGEVTDEAKWPLYHSADLFVLPTHSENFGIVVAEALAAGLPVITTHGAPWADVESYECGWWVKVGPEPLAEALAKAIRLRPEQRAEMGRRGRCLVEASYSWSRVGRNMALAYGWLLGRGPRPAFVRTVSEAPLRSQVRNRLVQV